MNFRKNAIVLFVLIAFIFSSMQTSSYDPKTNIFINKNDREFLVFWNFFELCITTEDLEAFRGIYELSYIEYEKFIPNTFENLCSYIDDFNQGEFGKKKTLRDGDCHSYIILDKRTGDLPTQSPNENLMQVNIPDLHSIPFNIPKGEYGNIYYFTYYYNYKGNHSCGESGPSIVVLIAKYNGYYRVIYAGQVG